MIGLVFIDATRVAIGAALRELCESAAKRIKDVNVIWDRIGGSKYLSRHYLLGRRSEAAPQPGGAHRETPRVSVWRDLSGNGQDLSQPDPSKQPTLKKPTRAWNLFLHHFHRGDDANVLHSHPWQWSLSLILSTGYREERRVGDEVISRLLLPFSINFIRADDYHRVDLLGPDCWTLFLAGPHVEGDVWYFWDRDTKLRSRWDIYVAWLRGKRADAAWEPEPQRKAA